MGKRILSILLVICLVLSPLPATAFAAETLYGDVNGDKAINMKDVLALQQYIANPAIGINKKVADVNADGNIDGTDLLILKKYIVGWDVMLGSPFCTVTYHTNGGSSIDTVKVRQGETIEKMPTPKKEDAIFLGWYTDRELTQKFYSEDVVNTNLNLYAKYAEAENQEQFTDNTFTLSEQAKELSFQITSANTSKSADEVLEEITLENVGESDYISLKVSGGNGSFTVSAEGGFIEGAAYKLTLDDTALIFAGKSSSYRTCTFTIAKAEVVDIKLNKDLIYIKSSEISDVMSGGNRVDTLAVAVLGNTDTDITGSFQYNGAASLQSGSKLCVYENVKPTDRNTTDDYSGDRVAYVEVTGVSDLTSVSGSAITFKSAEAMDVIATPDTLPISEAELTTYDATGSFSAELSSLDFSRYTDLGLDETTTVDQGDYVVITETDKDIVYGKVNSVSASGYESGSVSGGAITVTGGAITVSFDITTPEAMQKEKLDYYTEQSVDGDVMLESVDVPKMENEIELMAVDSGFAESALNYLAAAATKTEGFQQVSGVTDFVMTASDGSVLDPAAIQSLARGMQSEASNITADAVITSSTEHFGKGLHIAVRISGEIHIAAGEENEVVIGLSATFVEEVKMSFNANGGAVWKYWKGFIPYISDYKMNANIDVYTFTGVSVAATVSLAEQEDSSIDISAELKTLMESEDEEEITAGVQDLFKAYGEMLENETDYVNLLDKTIVEQKAWVDPFCIIAYSFQIDFVINANVNVALGCNLEYMSGTRYNFWFEIKAKQAGNSSMDLMDETFQFQFYAMGHLGLRVGLQFEFAVGLFSTDLASVGIVAEAGAYTDLFGYFFYDYNSVRSQGASQAERSSKMCGALYLEFGIYMEVSFKAQALSDRFVYNPTLYEHQWPLLHAGEQINVYDFGYEQPKEDDPLLIKDVTDYTLPDSIRYMDCLDLKEGDISINEYDLNKFYYTLSNKKFVLDENTGNIKVTVPENVRYMECDLTITWKPAKLAFSKEDLTRTIHLVWTNLTNTELKEKYDVCVKAGNNVVWSKRMNRGETPVLPTEAEILAMIGYDKYMANGVNLKYTGYTGYGNQTVSPATGNQTYHFGVTPREYTLTVNDVQNADGLTSPQSFTAKFGESFDLSMLAATGTNIPGTTYTRYFKTECSLENGRAATDGIDTVFAQQLLDGTCNYTAKYVDDACKITYAFNAEDGQNISPITEIIKKGTVPVFDYSGYLLNLGKEYMVKQWDKTIGKVSADTTFTALCGEPTGEKYTITFETNGGSSITEAQRYEGAALTMPAPPSKTGYTFDGWYADEQLTKAYIFKKMPSNSFTLYAKWIPRQYSVILNENGGDSLGNHTVSVTYDGVYGTLPTVTRSGYAFAGWYTAADGGTMVESTTPVAITSNQTLYAHWIEKANITGVATTAQFDTYDKNSHEFQITGTDLDGFTVKYKKAGDSDWHSDAVNAGKYAVMITRPADETYNAYELVLTDALIINRAVRDVTVDMPTYRTAAFSSITVNPVSIPNQDGTMVYAANTVNTAPASGWTTSATISGLSQNTAYYVFARVVGGNNYEDANSSGAVMRTGVKASTSRLTRWYIKTGTSSGAGTDGDVKGKVLFADGSETSRTHFDGNGNDFENGDEDCYELTISRDPWMISGINIGKEDGGTKWQCASVDFYALALTGIYHNYKFNIDTWFEDGYSDYHTEDFKRVISSAGSFSEWGGEVTVDSSSDGNISFNYDGSVIDKLNGAYNSYEKDDAPIISVSPSSDEYGQCYTYSNYNFTLDKKAIFEKMSEYGDKQIVLTIRLSFPTRSTKSDTATITRTLRINRS